MLHVEILRELTLEAPSSPGRKAHFSAASGVVRHGRFMYVIGDDELNLAVFSMEGDRPGRLLRLFEGELAVEESERQAGKPDLEALTTLPPFARCPHGALLALGSGTGDTRERGFVWALDEEGGLIGFPRVVDLSDLYRFLRRHVAEMNIEGVAVTGERLALFQRGNSEMGQNIVAHLDLAEVVESLSSDFRIDPSELLDIHAYDLGRSGGVDLAFTDGDSLPDGSLVFTAAAEPGGDDPDGSPAGSIVGILDPSGRLELSEPLEDKTIKLEGVDAVVAGEDVGVLLVSDADDPDVASPLLSATLRR